MFKLRIKGEGKKRRISSGIRGFLRQIRTGVLTFQADRLPEDKETLLRELRSYAIVSFDLFDTLLFRPVREPSDIFLYVGERLGVRDFKEQRIEAEIDARKLAAKTKKTYEVTLQDIYDILAYRVGIDPEEGMRAEVETELSACYGNANIRDVWQQLVREGRRIIVITDMYLPREVLTSLLEKNGFVGYERLFVSNVCGKSKAAGDMYPFVKKELGYGRKLPTHEILHIGDDVRSDYRKARKKGFDAKLYIPPRKGR